MTNNSEKVIFTNKDEDELSSEFLKIISTKDFKYLILSLLLSKIKKSGDEPILMEGTGIKVNGMKTGIKLLDLVY